MRTIDIIHIVDLLPIFCGMECEKDQKHLLVIQATILFSIPISVCLQPCP